MRGLSTTLEKKLASRIQAGNSNLTASLWVSRPNTPLTEDTLLERQEILPSTSISKASVAVCRPRVLRGATEVYAGYTDSGTAKVSKAVYNSMLSKQVWTDTGFSEPADDISLCFDGTMPMGLDGKVEFVTEGDPWVFWVSEGALYTRQLGKSGKTILAEANCRAVSAVRATWSVTNQFNFGIVVFFILGGYLYYRQRIGSTWYDAELVTQVPSGVLWSDVSAFRTWDYRIGVQLISETGAIYEVFTQYMGIGTRSAEHFEMKSAKSSGTLTGVSYHSVKSEGEHLTVSDAHNTMLYGGCYEPGAIEAIEAWNSDDGSGDWGRYLNVRFTKEINLHQVLEQGSCFSLSDSEGTLFYPTSISADYTGRILTFEFMSFNNAVGDITIEYVPGTVASMCEELLPAFKFTITPKGLIPVEGLPEVVRAWNSDGEGATVDDGRYVNVQFDQPLQGELSDNWDKFIVIIEQWIYQVNPETPMTVSVPFIDMYWHPTEENTIQFKFGSGSANSLQKCAGDVFVVYRGGTLYGDKGPLLSFSARFTPEGIAYRGDISDGEHLTISSAKATNTLTKVSYSSYEAPGEHLTMVGASQTSKLTHIDSI